MFKIFAEQNELFYQFHFYVLKTFFLVTLTSNLNYLL